MPVSGRYSPLGYFSLLTIPLCLDYFLCSDSDAFRYRDDTLYLSYLPLHTGLCLAADRHIFKLAVHIITIMTALLVDSAV
jgi:hypothetical protein